MKAQPIIIKNLSLAELIALEAYALKESYGSPVNETERQAERRFVKQERSERRFVKQERWRGIMARVKLELKRRTKEVI